MGGCTGSTDQPHQAQGSTSPTPPHPGHLSHAELQPPHCTRHIMRGRSNHIGRVLAVVLLALLAACFMGPSDPGQGQQRHGPMLPFLLLPGAAAQTQAQTPIKWTLLVYMLADNNLECFGILDLIVGRGSGFWDSWPLGTGKGRTPRLRYGVGMCIGSPLHPSNFIRLPEHGVWHGLGTKWLLVREAWLWYRHAAMR